MNMMKMKGNDVDCYDSKLTTAERLVPVFYRFLFRSSSYNKEDSLQKKVVLFIGLFQRGDDENSLQLKKNSA